MIEKIWEELKQRIVDLVNNMIMQRLGDLGLHGVYGEPPRLKVNAIDRRKIDIGPFKYFFDGVFHDFKGMNGYQPIHDPNQLGGALYMTREGKIEYESNKTLDISKEVNSLVFGSYAYKANNSPIIMAVSNKGFCINERNKNAYIAHGIGPLMVLNGGLVKRNILNPCHLDQEGGFGFISTCDPYAIDPKQSIKMMHHYKIDGNWTITEPTNEIDFNNYNDGFDLKVADDGKYLCHTLMHDLIQDNFYLIISRDQYNSIEEARCTRFYRGMVEDSSAASIVKLAKIIVKKNGTEICDLIDQRPLVGSNVQ